MSSSQHFEEENLPKTVALVHIHTPEPAVVKFWRDSGMPGAFEKAGRSKFVQNLRQGRKNPV
jgi:hypothetical protein